MPHQCTECGRTFDDGSKEMLSGCPDCGGNKFQFQPSSAQSAARKAAAESDASSSADDADTAAADTADAPPSDTVSGVADASDTPEPTAGTDSDITESTDSSTTEGTDSGITEGTDSSTTDPSADRERWTVDRELSEFVQGTETETGPATDQFDVSDDAEIETTTADEDRAQRDARSTPTTSEEINEARRTMAESEPENLADVDENDDYNKGRSTHGRGTPQGPPTDGPDQDAAEKFGLDGAVGGPDEQPPPNAADQHGSEAETPEPPETDLSALREELNDQFESIKITAPGQYELNLMELYDRKEYIISLQEDGRYVVDIPEGYEYRDE